MRAHPLGVVFSATILGCALVAGADEFNSFDAAYGSGVASFKRMKYDEARTALEAALTIAPDEKQRIRTYEALIQVYRHFPDLAPMIQAQEYLIAHAPNRLGRLSPSNGLASFLHQRGAFESQAAIYEESLNKDPDDIVALTMLKEFYRSKREQKSRLKDITAQLDKLEAINSAKHARTLEAEAVAEPRRAGHLWKEAAVAWRDAGDKTKALAAAAQAEQAAPPDSQLNAHFFHRHLGEVYADCDRPKEAIAHLEKALAATDIKGYRDACQARIDELHKLMKN